MAASPPGDDGLPPGWRVGLDRRTIRAGADVLIGGSPTAALRLSTAGSRLLEAWTAGAPVGVAPSARRLARRITDRGLAHPVPVGHPTPPVTVTVVIPVRDRPEGLAATVGGLGPDVALIVVDDGSLDPDAVDAVAPPRARVHHHDRSRGPAGARNTGWRMAQTDVVAFVDADVDAAGPWLEVLGRAFADPTLGAVAPRVVAAPGPATPRWLAAYEAQRSPLDLGPAPSAVRPRSRVPYVPTTSLVVRRQALADLDGFDEALRSGEDVDLIWRLVRSGWRVRYEPMVTVTHPVRDGLGAWMRQRFGYGRSAAPLHARHGDAVAPLVVTPWGAATLIAVAAGFPLAGAAVSAASVGLLVTGLDRRLPVGAVVRIALGGQAHALRSGAAAVRRVWWPIAATAAVAVPRTRRVVLAAAVVAPLASWVRRRPPLDPLRWTLLWLADDIAYGAGVWAGALAARDAGALLPAVVRPVAKSRPRRRRQAWRSSAGVQAGHDATPTGAPCS